MTRLALLLVLLAGCHSAPVTVGVYDGDHRRGWGVVADSHHVLTGLHVVTSVQRLRVACGPWRSRARVEHVYIRGGHEPSVLLKTERRIPWDSATFRLPRKGDSGSPVVAGGEVIGLVYGWYPDGSVATIPVADPAPATSPVPVVR